MPDFSVLEPQELPPFHIDWELTMKCNLDCSYCGSHDNSTKHPGLEECLETVDFILEYANIYIKRKPKNQKRAILNIFGGEAIYHPNIVEIIDYAKYIHRSKYKKEWHLEVHMITNALATKEKWTKIVSMVDYFTVSYHTENTSKQQKQIEDNLLFLKESGKGYHCAILMHPDFFNKNLSMIEFCKTNDIKYLPRQLDQDKGNKKFSYDVSQVQWFDNLYKRKSDKPLPSIKIEKTISPKSFVDKIKNIIFPKTDMAKVGRACCGGSDLCVNQNLESKVFFIPDNNFKGWSCSVNKMFLFVKQIDKTVYHNKDCRMNFDGTVSPIGTLDNKKAILELISRNDLPTIVCRKDKCWCGLCAPKAKTDQLYKKIISRYELTDSTSE